MGSAVAVDLTRWLLAQGPPPSAIAPVEPVSALSIKGSKYYEDLEAALLHAKALGLYVHLTVFCDQVEDSPVWMSTPAGQAAQLDHLTRVIEVGLWDQP